MAGNTTPVVGVLALQGDFREHLAVLAGLGARTRSVRRSTELSEIDGLVIPGGESTVIDKLSRAFGLAAPLRDAIASGLPVYGTCAGLIMLADRLVDAPASQQTFGGLDVTVRRNAFGTQTDSFETDFAIPELGAESVHAVFIRAPVVEQSGDTVEVLARIPDGRAVAVRQRNLLGTSFHPEMNDESRFHELFLRMVAARR